MGIVAAEARTGVSGGVVLSVGVSLAAGASLAVGVSLAGGAAAQEKRMAARQSQAGIVIFETAIYDVYRFLERENMTFVINFEEVI